MSRIDTAQLQVKSSKPESIYLETPLSSLEMLESRGVTFSINSIIETTDTPIQEAISSAKYIDSSAVSVGGLLRDDLSPIDLSTVTKGSLVSTVDINAAVSSMTPKLSSVNSFQAPADNITKILPSPEATDDFLADKNTLVFDYQDSLTDKNTLVFDYQDSLTAALSRTMVLVATQDSDPEMCSTGGTTPMLKSLQWVSIDDITAPKGATMLCKQENGSLEVVNQFHLMEMK